MWFTPENCSPGYGSAKYSKWAIRCKVSCTDFTLQHIHTVHVSGAESLFARLHERLPQKRTMTKPHRHDLYFCHCLFLSILSLSFSPLQVCLHRPTPSPLLRLSCLQRLQLPSILLWVRCCWPHGTCHQDMPTTPLQLSCIWTTQLTTQVHLAHLPP